MKQKKHDFMQKRWIAHCWAASLAQQCHNRDNQSDNTNSGTDDRTIKQSTLSTVLADKTALVYNRLTFIGYLKTIFALFKAAFCHKKRKGSVKFVGCVIEEFILRDTPASSLDKHHQNIV